jgi:hypothetical protein
VAIGGGLWLLTTLPYLVAYLNAPRGHAFNGFFYIADDATTYVSKMREGAEGAWGWTDRYISTPQPRPELLFLFYVLWGKLAGLLRISLYAGYHLARLSGAIALTAAARALARRTLPDPGSRRLALALALLGSGVGYLVLLARSPTILGQPLEALDLHLPELSGLFSIAAIPHFAWSAALMAWSLLALMDLARARGWRQALPPAVRAAALMAALCVIHPQMLFVLAALAPLHLLDRRTAPLAIPRLGLRAATPAWALTAAAFLAEAPLLAYYLHVLTGDPVIVEWSHQWRHQAPGPLSLALALGLPLALAVWGALRGADRGLPEQRLMAAWVVLVGLLLYLPNPVNIQRRLLDGIYLPVAVLAAAGVAELVRRRAARAGGAGDPGGGRRGAALRFRVAAVSAISSLLVLGIGLFWGLTRAPHIYVDADAVSAMTLLAASPHLLCDPPAILSHPGSGLWIPARAGYRVVTGHYSETLSYLDRSRQALAALRDGGAGMRDLMQAEDASLVWIGPTERAAGAATPDPAYFDPLFETGDVTVYRLRGFRPAPAPPPSALGAPCGSLRIEPILGG